MLAIKSCYLIQYAANPANVPVDKNKQCGSLFKPGNHIRLEKCHIEDYGRLCEKGRFKCYNYSY